MSLGPPGQSVWVIIQACFNYTIFAPTEMPHRAKDDPGVYFGRPNIPLSVYFILRVLFTFNVLSGNNCILLATTTP